MDDSTTTRLLDLAEKNNRRAVSELMDQHRSRIRRMIAIHMDQDLMARVDPSDVVQEALIEATSPATAIS